MKTIKTICVVWQLSVLALLLFLLPPASVQAQFTFTTNNGALTITGYTGPGGEVIIPSATNGLPVTSIGNNAFFNKTSLTSVAIPNSVTNIGDQVFYRCASLTNVSIGNGVTSIGNGVFLFCSGLTAITVDAVNSVYSSVDGVLFDKGTNTLIQCPGGKAGSYGIPNSVTSIVVHAFSACYSLTSVTIGDSVTSIGSSAFDYCGSLTSVMIGNSVTSIGDYAFYSSTNLRRVYFRGNAPSLGTDVFTGDNKATVYYLPGTTGWGATLGGRPTARWLPQILTSDNSFGVRTNQLGFNISWASNMAVAVDACTNLANPVWTPLQTNTLTSDTLYFSDPQWTNHPARFYRLRWP